MPPNEPADRSETSLIPSGIAPRGWVRRFVTDYAWFIGKNIIGWTLMLSALALSPLPGPGGIPLFLIGFAMVSFFGKRRLTARVLRGRALHLDRPLYIYVRVVVAILLLVTAYWLAEHRWRGFDAGLRSAPLRAVLLLLASSIACWLVVQLALEVTNLLLAMVPRIRRAVRPWLRDHGIRLLPPRIRHRHGHPHPPASSTEEILEFHPRHRERIVRWWAASWRWFVSAGAIAALMVVLLLIRRGHG